MLNYHQFVHSFLAAQHYYATIWRMRKKWFDPKLTITRSLYQTIDDAKDYLQIDTDEFFRLACGWNAEEQRLFSKKTSTHSFYLSWNNEVSPYNICANILNQHYDTASFAAVLNCFCSSRFAGKTIVDYGCGTAAMSLGLKILKVMPSKLILTDVGNDVRSFIEYRIGKYGLERDVEFRSVDEAHQSSPCSGLYCIDVLEHVENPSKILKEKIHPSLKINGLLYLKAPWGGHSTHLQTAADDFYRNGGRRLLKNKYRLLWRIKHLDVACVYQKTEA